MSKFLRPVKPEDFLQIRPHAAYDADPGVMFRLLENVMNLPATMSTTLLDSSGKPIAVFCGLPLYPRVFELCAYVDKSVEECGLRYAKVTKHLVEAAFRVHDLNRMQITVRADQSWAGRWATFLGFNFEGRLRKYGAEGVDHFLYAKVRE